MRAKHACRSHTPPTQLRMQPRHPAGASNQNPTRRTRRRLAQGRLPLLHEVYVERLPLLLQGAATHWKESQGTLRL